MAKSTKAKAKPKAGPGAAKSAGPRSASAVDRQIGELIRTRRLAQGVSQQKLAADLKLTFQQVQKYEKGVNRVAASTLMRIARALDCKITDLLPAATVLGALGSTPWSIPATVRRLRG